MRVIMTVLVGIVCLGLWFWSGTRAQPQARREQQTVQAQFTAIVEPSPTPSPATH